VSIRSALVLSVVFAHLPCWAQFQPISAVSVEAPYDWQMLARATVLIEKTSSGDSRCSGVVVSREGHILTARHCLQQCLIQTEVFTPKRSKHGVDFFELNRTKLGTAVCDAVIDGTSTRIRVVATSPGLIVPADYKSFETLEPETYQALRERGFTSQGDFAIVQPETQLSGKSCAQLSAVPAKRGDHVATLGFPSETFRPDGANSDGESLFVSSGVVVPGIGENSCLQSSDLSAYKMATLERSFNEDSAILSTVDGVEGSSGSPLINARSEVVGVLIQVYSHRWTTGRADQAPDQRYCAGSVKALRIERIRSIVREVNPEVWDNLRCKFDQMSALRN
jgi:hypothetical protein